MCLVFLALDQHKRYPFILAANRDEFYNRPAAPAHFWPEWPDVVAGQDLGAPASLPGTWLGMTRGGRLALITNYRDLTNIRPDARSRGELVSRFLTVPEITNENYLKTITDSGDAFNGFNLVFGSTSELMWYSNHSQTSQILRTGIFGLSNALLDSSWPKVDQGKAHMRTLLDHPDPQPEDFFDMLANADVYADHLLPETGVGLVRERQLSAAFIRINGPFDSHQPSGPTTGYGTRCSTVIMCDSLGNVWFCERTFAPLTGAATDVVFRFHISTDGQKI